MKGTYVLTDNNSTRNVWPTTVAILMIVVAFSYALKNTHDLEWPAEVDFFRDMGAVESILADQGTADSLFYDEVRWYNPAVPTIVALVVNLTDQSVNKVYAQIGPYLNLLGPITFFIFSRLLIGNWAAVFALGAYLFLGNHAVVTWHQATYSAWAWPWNVAHAMFFLTASAVITTYRSNSYLWAIASGFLLGLTLLFHTAPAFILTLFVTVLAFRRFFVSDTLLVLRQQISLYFLIGATSILVALPFLGPLALEYGFDIKNREPTKYVAIGFSDVIRYSFNFRFVLFLVAFVLLWIKPSLTGLSKTVTLDLRILSTLVVVLLVVAFGIQFMRAYGIDLPQLYPSFHFHIYFKIIEAMLFGLGLCLVSRGIVLLVSSAEVAHLKDDARPLALSISVFLVYIGIVFPAYTQRMDFSGTRQAAIHYAEQTEEIELYDWLLANTSIDDVFLAEGDARLISVSAAGRKVIVHGGMFTSPYLDFDQRLQDHQLLYASLNESDLNRFAVLASDYSIDFIIVNKEIDSCCNGMLSTNSMFKKAFSNPLYDVFRYQP